jgi:NAD(P)-dependent dehydrogenase (short-subunit alcohol dehydrogenase family)
MPGSPAPGLSRGIPWLLLAVLAGEFLLFDQVGAKRITSFYPRWDDQVQYLGEAYVAYERARAGGFFPALRDALLQPTAQGTLHDALALIVFQFAGPSRSAALALNVLALLLWQGALYLLAVRSGAGRAFALAAALLPLALTGPWETIPGSAYDFRLDHATLCLLGATSCLAVLTGGFRHRGAALAFGAAVGVTVLTRFLSATYLLVVFGAAAAWLLRAPDRGRRLANLALAAAVAVAVAGPILWLSRGRIVDYYWVGHITGPESVVRAADLDLVGSVAFAFRHLGERHLGLSFALAALLGAAGFALAARTRGPGAGPPARWGAIFLLAPLLVLALHRQKSEVVLSALVPGVVLLVLAGWRACGGGSDGGAVRSGWRGALVWAVPLACLGIFAQRQFRPAYDPDAIAQLRQVNTLADALFRRLDAAPFPEPELAIDHLNDAFNAEVLRVVFYERHRRWLPIRMSLPTGVVAPHGGGRDGPAGPQPPRPVDGTAGTGRPVSLRSHARRTAAPAPDLVHRAIAPGWQVHRAWPDHDTLPAPRNFLRSAPAMKIVLTGSSSGIGRALAARLLGRGHDVWGLARSDQADFAAGEPRFRGLRCDVAAWDQVAAAAAAVHREAPAIDALIACAGLQGEIGRALAADPVRWSATVRANLDGTYFALRAFAPLLARAERRAKIVCFSGGGATKPRSHFSAYGVAKTGVVRLVETIAEEERGRPLDINAIAPGAINTRLTDEVLALGPDVAGAAEYAAAQKQKAGGGGSLERATSPAAFPQAEIGREMKGADALSSASSARASMSSSPIPAAPPRSCTRPSPAPTRSGSSCRVTSRAARSPPRATPAPPARSACAWPPAAPARPTSFPPSPTPTWTPRPLVAITGQVFSEIHRQERVPGDRLLRHDAADREALLPRAERARPAAHLQGGLPPRPQRPPGPVVIDIPKDVQQAKFQPVFPATVEFRNPYIGQAPGDRRALQQVLDLIAEAATAGPLRRRRPHLRRGHRELKAFAERPTYPWPPP